MNPDKGEKKPGPVPDRLKIDEDDWKKAVDKALGKKRPPEGWPKPGDKADQRDKSYKDD